MIRFFHGIFALGVLPTADCLLVLRPHRLTVRTGAFQALNRSSTLRGVTKRNFFGRKCGTHARLGRACVHFAAEYRGVFGWWGDSEMHGFAFNIGVRSELANEI